MGDIKRKKRLFSRPKQRFDRQRIDEEDVLVKKYGLKNKKEIWKAKSAISRFRRRAKELIKEDAEEQRNFFEKLNKMGIGVADIAGVLALTEENLLDRRLQTVLFKKGFANSPRQARQLVTHRNVLVDGNVVNIPSFLITRDLEDNITLKERNVQSPKEKEEVIKTEEGNKEVSQ